MSACPGAVFIIDPQRERIAVTEARKLEIPVIGTGDTNVDPDELDYIIPANDDAIRADPPAVHAGRRRGHRGRAGARRACPPSRAEVAVGGRARVRRGGQRRDRRRARRRRHVQLRARAGRGRACCPAAGAPSRVAPASEATPTRSPPSSPARPPRRTSRRTAV